MDDPGKIEEKVNEDDLIPDLYGQYKIARLFK